MSTNYTNLSGRPKTVNRIKAAKFTVRPAFEDFDFTAERSITKAEIKEIYTLGWLNDARPLLLIGETGVGKTFIAQAVGLHACASGKSVLYMSITALQENLAIARSSGSYLRYRAKLAKFDLIVFDEMGMRKFTATEAQICAKSSKNDPSISRSPSPPNCPWLTGTKSSPIPLSSTPSGIASSTPRSPSTSPAPPIGASKLENLPQRKRSRRTLKPRLRR